MAKVKNKSARTRALKAWRIRLIIALLAVFFIAVPVLLWALLFNGKAILTPYNADFYTFSYPQDWVIQRNDRARFHGTEYILQPTDTASPEDPHVIINVIPATEKTINNFTDPFTHSNYTESDTIVDNVKAQKYTAVFSTRAGDFHSTVYVFHTNGYIYLLSLEYKQATDTKLESEFDQIVDSFATK